MVITVVQNEKKQMGKTGDIQPVPQLTRYANL